MFFRSMRIIILALIGAGFFLSSCSNYQRVLRKGEVGEKFVYADSLYQIGKYKKALKLMEEIVPAYRGKPQAEKLMYIYADTYFQLKDYYLSGYQFERFVQAYPGSDSIEVAFFKSALSFYNLSEPYSLDQRETYRALEKLQSYINTYPDSGRREEANRLVSDLRTRLEKKEFEVAKQYYHIADYKAAITSFENFIADNPGTGFREQAFLYRLKAGYDLAVNSIPILVEERLKTAKRYYNNYMRYYKDAESAAEAIEIERKINEQLESLQSEKTTS